MSPHLKIDLVCTDPAHPIMPWLRRWVEEQTAVGHDADVVHASNDIQGGDLLLLVACHEILSRRLRERYRHTLVTHASDLPVGRGWSPLVWTIASGRNDVIVSLIEAEDQVDAGAVWSKVLVKFEGHETLEEINERYFPAVISLFDYAMRNFGTIEPTKQDEKLATSWRRRTPEDSRLDPDKTLSEQFNLLRVVDPLRYPAWFEFRGHIYELYLHKRGPVTPRIDS